jgi:hypothetical protein
MDFVFWSFGLHVPPFAFKWEVIGASRATVVDWKGLKGESVGYDAMVW